MALFYDSQNSDSMSPDNTAVQSQKPFLIELRREQRKHTSLFVPAASLHITPALRTSGLLNALEPDAVKSLLFLLTFLTPEGRPHASLFHLAEAMQLSHSKVQSRMQHLGQGKWKKEPIVIESKSENGYIAYSLNPRLISYRSAPEPEQMPAPRTSSRERVIEYSRQHYARPRAEVERVVAGQLGHDEQESEAERRLRYRLENNGLNSEQARALVLSHDPEVIERQLDWLPHRQAKNPAGYLVAAIEGNYDEPRTLRARRTFDNREFRFQLPDEQVFGNQVEDHAALPTTVQEEWQDGQGQPLGSMVADSNLADETDTTRISQVPDDLDTSFEELPFDTDASDPNLRDDELSPEEAMEKAEAIGPEDRWISLTPDE